MLRIWECLKAYTPEILADKTQPKQLQTTETLAAQSYSLVLLPYQSYYGGVVLYSTINAVTEVHIAMCFWATSLDALEHHWCPRGLWKEKIFFLIAPKPPSIACSIACWGKV